MKSYAPQLHGALRGLAGVASSPQFEGRFGRMFRTLPPASLSEQDLKALASAMTAEAEEEQTPETEPDSEENSGISAGFTYLGQFIDHDLTFDPTSSLQKQNDPDALVDFRTPRFDLDCLYGSGPEDQPYLYQVDGVRMLLGRRLTGNPEDPKAQDLPRNSPETGPRRALIGDPRNDENVIVSQLHATFLRFHNRVVDFLGDSQTDFRTVQRLVRWHYQWVVLYDFLPTIIGQNMVDKILPHLTESDAQKYVPDLRLYQPRKEPFIPVEFSVAAYRFGHSMVRPVYRLSRNVPTDGKERLAIFSEDPNASLGGFREFPDNWAIEWNLFFKMAPAPQFGPQRVQPAYKIDSSLVNPLGNLPTSIASQITSLAERNLLRGLRMGLPSGQAVARRMGEPVIPDEQLHVGRATKEDSPKNGHLVDISPRFRNNAPLWYYVLAEAQQKYQSNPPPDNSTPVILGPVGGRIVGEVFIGLLLSDRHSFLIQDPLWHPFPEFMQDNKFGVAELVREAMKA